MQQPLIIFKRFLHDNARKTHLASSGLSKVDNFAPREQQNATEEASP